MGRDFEGGDGWVIFHLKGHAFTNPACDGFESVGIRGEFAAATVGRQVCGFEKEEALLGGVCEDAAAAAFFNDVFVVFGGFVAEQGETEPILTDDGFCMARAGVASRLCEDGHDIIDERCGPLFRGGGEGDCGEDERPKKGAGHGSLKARSISGQT